MTLGLCGFRIRVEAAGLRRARFHGLSGWGPALAWRFAEGRFRLRDSRKSCPCQGGAVIRRAIAAEAAPHRYLPARFCRSGLCHDSADPELGRGDWDTHFVGVFLQTLASVSD